VQVILRFVEPVFTGRLTNRPENVRSICISDELHGYRYRSEDDLKNKHSAYSILVTLISPNYVKVQ
jgi:hypothetical protein